MRQNEYFWKKVFPAIAPVLLTIVVASLLIPAFQNWSSNREEALVQRRESLEGIIENSYRFYARLELLESMRQEIGRAIAELEAEAEAEADAKMAAATPDRDADTDALPVAAQGAAEPADPDTDPDLLLLKSKFIEQDDRKNEAGEDFFAGLLYAEYVFRDDEPIVEGIAAFRDWYEDAAGQLDAEEFKERRIKLIRDIAPHVQD